ncbi:MAG TPA: serine/threonine-protein kinase [Kofleriaceae bacterium]|nr:serine/threonine-protein kinase [Kofleriaceae bacterium]
MSDRPASALTSAASTVADSEEARAFFQSRLATFGKALFLLSAIAWVALAALYVFNGGGKAGQYPPLGPGGSLHLAGALTAGALWLTTRRGRLPPRVLDWLDTTSALAIITLFAGAGGATSPTVGVFIALLSFNTGMLTRAIVVPSTARRTILIGQVAGAAVVGFAVWRGPPGAEVLTSAVPTACWSLVGIAVGALASQTIFGLRREAREARVMGQYRLEAKIGEGGMGEVWRASHALLRRPTAVKLLPPDRMGEDEIRRFEREVRLTARLTHPGTVAIYDYGRTRDGIFYYAMELLDGTDLERLVARDGPLPPGRVVHVVAQICGALAEAHDLGLVHRDVKPANVLVSPRSGEHEFAKILDFGLVKTIDTGDQAGATAITAANRITGTPLYMSREAIRAPATVDRRSDLYGLGAMAWFLLVGRPPFAGKNILDVCSMHLHETPTRPSVALGRPIPVDLEDAVLACLEKEPDARPPGARALRDRLERSSAAGLWTAADAEAWWRDHPRRGQDADGDGKGGGKGKGNGNGGEDGRGERAALARTIALDVSAREMPTPVADQAARRG